MSQKHVNMFRKFDEELQCGILTAVALSLLSRNDTESIGLSVKVASAETSDCLSLGLLPQIDKNKNAIQVQENLLSPFVDRIVRRCSIAEFADVLRVASSVVPNGNFKDFKDPNDESGPVFTNGWNARNEVDLRALVLMGSAADALIINRGSMTRNLRENLACMFLRRDWLSSRLKLHTRVSGNTTNNVKTVWDKVKEALPGIDTTPGVAGNPFGTEAAEAVRILTANGEKIKDDATALYAYLCDMVGDSKQQLLVFAQMTSFVTTDEGDIKAKEDLITFLCRAMVVIFNKAKYWTSNYTLILEGRDSDELGGRGSRVPDPAVPRTSPDESEEKKDQEKAKMDQDDSDAAADIAEPFRFVAAVCELLLHFELEDLSKKT